MSIGLISLILLVLAGFGYGIGRRRAVAAVGGDIRKLHSLPSFYGAFAALMTAVPAFLLIGIWLLVQPYVVESRALSLIAPSEIPSGSSATLVMADVRRVAAGLETLAGQGVDVRPLLANTATLKATLNDAGVVLETEPTPSTLAAAVKAMETTRSSNLLMTAAALVLALGGLVFGLTRIHPDYRARNATENFPRCVPTLLLAVGAERIRALIE